MRLSFSWLVVVGVALAVALPTGAQERAPLTPDQQAALYGLPVVTTVGGALLILNTDADSWVSAASFFALPLVAVGTTCAAGRLTGAPGSCRAAFASGTLWALPGAALIGLGVASGEFGGVPDLALGAILIGAAAYVLIPPFAAADGFRRGATDVGLTALPAPDGAGLIPGAALRLRF